MTMTTMEASPVKQDVLGEIQRDGISLVRGLLTPDDIKAISAETDWFLSNKRPWFKVEQRVPETYASVSPTLVPAGELDTFARIRKVFSKPFFRDVCNAYLDCDAVIDRIVFSRSQPSDRPITLWHADQQAEGRLSLKFMLYLTKTTSQNGAFSYVKGSHAVVHSLMAKAAAAGVPNVRLQSFAQIEDACQKYGGETERNWLESVRSHITGDFASDDHFSVEADEGSVLFFDTKGLHRGGVIRNGERKLVRIHCFEPEVIANPVAWGRAALGKLRSFNQPRAFTWG